MYEPLKFSITKATYGDSNNIKIPTFIKFMSAGISGGACALISNPTDLIKTRMIA